jgi:hypothetical protein
MSTPEPRPPLPPGTRVRHYGQQFPRAHREGTATVAAIDGPHRDSSWEYLIYHDRTFSGLPGEEPASWWSSLMTIPVRCRESWLRSGWSELTCNRPGGHKGGHRDVRGQEWAS